MMTFMRLLLNIRSLTKDWVQVIQNLIKRDVCDKFTVQSLLKYGEPIEASKVAQTDACQPMQTMDLKTIQLGLLAQ